MSQRVAGAEVIRATSHVTAASRGEVIYLVPAALVREMPVVEVEVVLTTPLGDGERTVGQYTLLHGGSLHRR